MKKLFNRVKKELVQEHEGAVAFEYVIILVIMAVCIFSAWGMLGDMVIHKAGDIANFIGNNGSGGVNSINVTNRVGAQWGH